MSRIIRSPAAETDAVDIWSYIVRDNPAAADQLLDRIDQTLWTLATIPASENQPRFSPRIFDSSPPAII